MRSNRKPVQAGSRPARRAQVGHRCRVAIRRPYRWRTQWQCRRV